MLTLLLANWRYVVMALLLAAVGFYKWDADRWEKKYYTFEASVKAVGEAQNAATAAKIMADKLAKDTSDALYADSLGKLNGTIKRLRDEHARSGLVPAAPSGSSNPSLACFDRPILIGALRSYEAEIEGLLGEGDEAAVGLNTAKVWSQHLRR